MLALGHLHYQGEVYNTGLDAQKCANKTNSEFITQNSRALQTLSKGPKP